MSADKQSYKIGEVARRLGVKTSVLRFWETEFPGLKAGRTRSGHRVYGAKELALVTEIRRLLYEEKLTIPGARAALRKGAQGPVVEDRVAAIRREILELLALVKD